MLLSLRTLLYLIFIYKYKKRSLLPEKGPKGFGGTTLISRYFHICSLINSVNAGYTPHFNYAGLRGRFHSSRTESFHHSAGFCCRDSSLGLLPVYYSLHRHKYLLGLLYSKKMRVSRGRKEFLQLRFADNSSLFLHVIFYLFIKFFLTNNSFTYIITYKKRSLLPYSYCSCGSLVSFFVLTRS